MISPLKANILHEGETMNKFLMAVAGVLLGASFMTLNASDSGQATDTTASKWITTQAANGDATFQVVYPNAPSGSAANRDVKFSKIRSMATKWYVPKKVARLDGNQVVVTRMYKMPKFFSLIPGMPDHRDLGRMSFKQVGDMDVWFGDWEDVPRGGGTASNYSVYYSGSNPTTNMPTTGTATYSVKGINNYVAHNSTLLTGTLTADFGNNDLTGTISKTGLSITIDAAISGNSFSGTATSGSANGQAKGAFYGNNASALAGIATFGTNDTKNTAFGGTKN